VSATAQPSHTASLSPPPPPSHTPTPSRAKLEPRRGGGAAFAQRGLDAQPAPEAAPAAAHEAAPAARGGLRGAAAGGADAAAAAAAAGDADADAVIVNGEEIGGAGGAAQGDLVVAGQA